jgi:DNA-binding MarR family transcriptional regulator
MIACTNKEHDEVASMSEPTGKQVDGIAASCIAVRLRLLNRVVTNLYDETLRPLGLKVSQLNLLVVAAKLGVARPTRVSELLHLDLSTLSRNVDRMMARGWLEAVAEEDARTQPFRLTDQGRRLLGRAIPAWEKAQKQAAELLGEDGVAWLNETAGKLGLPQAKR